MREIRDDDQHQLTTKRSGTLTLGCNEYGFPIIPRALLERQRILAEEKELRNEAASTRAKKRVALKLWREERRAQAERAEILRKEREDAAYLREIARLHRVWEEKQRLAALPVEAKAQVPSSSPKVGTYPKPVPRWVLEQARAEAARREAIWKQSLWTAEDRWFSQIDIERLEDMPYLPAVSGFNLYMTGRHKLNRAWPRDSAKNYIGHKRNLGKKPRSRRPWQAD